ncbi:dTMP kinase [Candidatus Pacearchaeota archaeon]|nr:dTMP kinase [Candidatus Pacearchaeota archaeon]
MNVKRRPLLITFEGGEGSGKTTQLKGTNQVEGFYSWFVKNYGEAILLKEPGGEPVAEKIRDILLSKGNSISSMSELFLFEAARSQLYSSVINPSLRNKLSVLCDRSIDSTLAYQGYAGNINRELINQLNYEATSGRILDMTFIIDVSPEIGIKNAKKSKGRGTSRIDERDIMYHQKVAEGFREIARNNPKRCVLIPYVDGIEKVQDRIRGEFRSRYLVKF